MSANILLCIGQMALQNSQIDALSEQNFANDDWIKVFTDEVAARKHAITSKDVGQFWVRSTENISPINLAATIKKDRPDIKVVIACDAATGSLLSRARAAQIDSVLTYKEFEENYYSLQAKCKSEARSGLGFADGTANTSHIGYADSDASARPIVEGFSKETQPQSQAHTSKEEDCGVFYSTAPASEQDWLNSFDFVSGDVCLDNIQDSSGVYAQGSRRDESKPLEHEDQSCSPSNKHNQLSSISMNQNKECSLNSKQDKASSISSKPNIRYASNPVAISEKGALAKSESAEGVVVSIVSAEGGSGKSTVAVMSAYYAQSQGLRTVLLDLDGRLGDIQYLTGTSTAISSVDIIKSPEKISLLKCHDQKPALISAPIHAEEAELLTGKYSKIIELAKKNFDVVITNTSNFWNEDLINIMENSNKVIFLTDQRPSGIKATKHALSLCARCGMATTPFTFVLNRCKRKAWFTKEDISFALGGLPVEELQDGGEEVSELLGAGIPCDLLGEPNAFTESLKILLGDLLSIDTDSDHPKDGENRISKLFNFIPFAKRRGVACL